MNDQFVKHPSALSISDFQYELPDARIAKYPLNQRDSSKLLVYRNGEIDQEVFKNLPSLLQPEDCLVFNDTKVVHARIQFQRKTGGRREIFCLEPIEPTEITKAFDRKGSTVWRVLIGNSKQINFGEVLSTTIPSEAGNFRLNVEVPSKETDVFVVRFYWDADFTFAEVLNKVGILPLPPYLNRETEAEDEERYQTVYAEADGSVAAPTAGLHFTKEVFDGLKEQRVKALFVTLHVGAGTFMSVKTATMQNHEMHKERISVSVNTIENMRIAAIDSRIISVGTTSLRTIESIYWFGVKLVLEHEMTELFVDQWDPYELANDSVEVSVALDAVLNWMRKNNHSYLNGFTKLLIAPGYEIKMADALITNFHQPQSTLLLLVSAMIGSDWRKVYKHAFDNDFRFLSYGDSSILFRNKG
jgi:S-adenosylmethionine:tRNA ribosyltransferase-isomerase